LIARRLAHPLVSGRFNLMTISAWLDDSNDRSAFWPHFEG
jgi:hypothetical protein